MMKAKTGRNKHQSHTVDQALKDVQKGPEKALNIFIPEELHKAFKMKTTKEGTNMKEVLVDLISSYVDM